MPSPARRPHVRSPVRAGAKSVSPPAPRPSHSGDPNYMESLARGLAVIRAFSQQRTRMSIAQLAERTGIARAAVRRVLYTLCELGYAERDDDGHFTLRPQILALGHAYLSSAPLPSSAQPLLDQVSDEALESCSMAMLDGDEIVYVARSSRSARIMSIDLGVGSRLPAYCTSMGRVLLAHLPAADLAAYLRRLKIVAYTPRTQVSKVALARTLDIVRASGYAIVDQELELGLRSIAVPVGDGGRVAAALNVSVQAARVPLGEMEKRFLRPLQRAARELGLLVTSRS